MKLKIQFEKLVIFRDCNGNVLKIYNIGDIVDAWETPLYWVTGMGGIWKDEAIRYE